LIEQVRSGGGGGGGVALDRVAVSEAVYRATIADSDGRDESWLVSRRVGLDDDVRVPASVAAALGGRQLALLPRGGVAAPLDAAAADRRPARRAFCFLPLPLKTGLPVHVNAHFALDHEARRCLWPDDDAGAKADWNYLLVRDVVAPAYVSLLRRVPHYLSSSVVADNISLMESFGDEIPNLDAYGRLFPALPPGRGYCAVSPRPSTSASSAAMRPSSPSPSRPRTPPPAVLRSTRSPWTRAPARSSRWSGFPRWARERRARSSTT